MAFLNVFYLPDFHLPTGEGATPEDTKVSSDSLVPENRNGEVGARGDLQGNSTMIKAESSTIRSTFYMFLSPLPIYYLNQFI